jgi:prolyl-tRNA synthetase
MDDRDQRPGFKFKDADLLGIPIRITLGERSLEAGQVEWKERTSSESTMMGLTDAVELAAQKVRAAVGMG